MIVFETPFRLIFHTNHKLNELMVLNSDYIILTILSDISAISVISNHKKKPFLLFVKALMGSDHCFYRISYFFSIIVAWVKLLTYTDKSFESLHPSSRHFLIQHMRNLGGISSNCDAKHGDPHRPRGVAY